MSTTDALDCLSTLLDQHGFSASAPRLDLLWTALREWVAMPVAGDDPDDDLLLFQAHLFRGPATKYSPGPRFLLCFIRQFSYYRDDEYAGMEQLIAELTYADCPATRALVPGQRGSASEIWGNTGPKSTMWIADVEAEYSFQASAALAPTGFTLDRTPV
jgi:hypothetical protein